MSGDQTVAEALLQFVPLAFWIVITIIPTVRLLKRTGLHWAFAALNLIPFFGTIILIWIIAYRKWPKEVSVF